MLDKDLRSSRPRSPERHSSWEMDRGLFLSEGFFLASSRESGDSFLFVGVISGARARMPKPKSWMLVPDFFWCNGR